ncbi:uncharacterized protein BDR25DRAFT_309066 [Lindgomyces ingoldianus]|uniref:Uncharacterized protein n=1 Tax=Lindgomyces ingoldianus TaxID=673940 RepID=A0ACB6RHS5_9PLEO|nr:uncharacterized protein BDR25DRAFT_309066 [Lindgomyces ingoldianus]KAF2478285.1 hypothetical protein BDR25DRAFT_309066 [Lindgomyces ingoldianus]
MAQYYNVPPSAGGPFSPTAPYSPYPPSTTDSFNSQHPLFSPNTEYPSGGQWPYPQSPSGKGYQQPFEQHAPSDLPPRPRSLRKRISHHIQRLWLWEASACVVAVCAHFAMIALLGVYDGSRVSSWTGSWSLNSNISFMITIIKGAALIPVGGALSQLKWRRFWNYRKLTDMDFFDDASRGTLGSLRLLWHLKFWHFASFGAILTLAAFTMDTLVQNVVDTEHKLEITRGVATLPRTNNYATFNMYTSGEDPGDQLPWTTMVTAIDFGMQYTASYFWAGSNLFVYCLTGNCTFGTYQSLVVEPQCHDMTKYLDTSDADVYKMPDGLYLRKEDGLLNISSTTKYPSNDLFPGIGPLILNFQAIANPSLDKPVAIQCVMYWSVNTFGSTNMTNYTLYEVETSRWTNTSEAAKTEYKQKHGIWLIPPECYLNGTQIKDPAKDDRCINWITPMAQLGLQNLLTHDSIGMTGEVYKTKKGWSVSNLFANAAYYSTDTALRNETYNVLELTINNTAIMMSQGVRQLPTIDETNNYTWSPANGTVWQYETFYNIHFYYLGITHFVVGGSFLFLVLTIFLTRCDHPWKSSSLPLLFHGLTPQDRATVAEVPMMVDMREAAEKMKVKVTMTAVGQRLATREVVASG